MDFNTMDTIVKAMFSEMETIIDEAAAYRALYEQEKAAREAAEASRDYWREEANHYSALADEYISRSQEDPF